MQQKQQKTARAQRRHTVEAMGRVVEARMMAAAAAAAAEDKEGSNDEVEGLQWIAPPGPEAVAALYDKGFTWITDLAPLGDEEVKALTHALVATLASNLPAGANRMAFNARYARSMPAFMKAAREAAAVGMTAANEKLRAALAKAAAAEEESAVAKAEADRALIARAASEANHKAAVQESEAAAKEAEEAAKRASDLAQGGQAEEARGAAASAQAKAAEKAEKLERAESKRRKRVSEAEVAQRVATEKAKAARVAKAQAANAERAAEKAVWVAPRPKEPDGLSMRPLQPTAEPTGAISAQPPPIAPLQTQEGSRMDAALAEIAPTRDTILGLPSRPAPAAQQRPIEVLDTKGDDAEMLVREEMGRMAAEDEAVETELRAIVRQ